MQSVRATARYSRAIAAVSDLLARLHLEFAFVGGVARSAWLGTRVERGSIDVVALLTAEQKNQVAMMASNRGFRVERAEIEQSEELDLIPLNFVDAEGDVRVYVLVASNALYGRMVRDAVKETRVVNAEDLALLLALSDDEESQRAAQLLIRLPNFDRASYNRRLVSIGLPQLVVSE
ncbi:MAG TPA: hypothetical protein VGS96_10150 [Thermoanaerobaculia bacterium]|nr:hypothetical protein [Thermoanaerobaculia bacterium]